MTVYEKKAGFVENELSALVWKVDKDIGRLEYSVREDGEEFVYIYNKYGRIMMRVRVTADSLLALARDALRAIY